MNDLHNKFYKRNYNNNIDLECILNKCTLCEQVVNKCKCKCPNGCGNYFMICNQDCLTRKKCIFGFLKLPCKCKYGYECNYLNLIENVKIFFIFIFYIIIKFINDIISPENKTKIIKKDS